MTQTQQSSSSLAALISSRQPGLTLPQAFYTEPALFEQDLDKIFFRHWLMAGHVGRLPEPCSYFLYEIGNESVIITRDRVGDSRRERDTFRVHAPAPAAMRSDRQLPEVIA